MKTLGKQTTSSILGNDSWALLHERWSAIASDKAKRKELTPLDHFIYQCLRGKNWQKSFTRPTNTIKIENGAMVGWSMWAILQSAHSTYADGHFTELFGKDVINSEVLANLRARLPKADKYKMGNLAKWEKGWPFEPYNEEIKQIVIAVNQ